MQKIFIQILLVPLLTFTYQQHLVFAESSQLILNVHGLACPFCAFGLEKKLKKLNGFESYDADLKKGEVYVVLQEHSDVNITNIKKAVKEAGFTLIQISQKTNSETKILFLIEKENK